MSMITPLKKLKKNIVVSIDITTVLCYILVVNKVITTKKWKKFLP